MSYVTINNSNFETEVMQSKLPVLIDFWAPWCMPCKMIAPFIEEIAKEFDGKVKVCKLNTDEAGETAMKYGISSIPTLALFKDGKEVKRQVGAMQKKNIIHFISDE